MAHTNDGLKPIEKIEVRPNAGVVAVMAKSLNQRKIRGESPDLNLCLWKGVREAMRGETPSRNVYANICICMQVLIWCGPLNQGMHTH